MSVGQGASRLLSVCSAIGWALGVLVALSFLLLVWVGERTVAAEQRRSEANMRTFISQVRACRREATRGPPPSWSECERRVRAEL
ncbi:hypothetical protein [Phenylobacterium sp.]|jgi:hypothetical protein|uniref:hypothetical protein n=1 Tax=Phenylobacterium sp. TaxID=1871053 RepID=UPI002F422C58